MILEQFQVQEISVDVLHKAPWNYKTEDEEMAKKLAANLRRNGILQPSIVYVDDGNHIVLDGNHRLDAYKLIGVDVVPCVVLDGITENEAKRIAIEINETKFGADMLKLSQVINDLGEEFEMDELEETLPYSMDELEDIKLLDGVDLGDDDPPSTLVSLKKTVECPECGNQFEA